MPSYQGSSCRKPQGESLFSCYTRYLNAHPQGLWPFARRSHKVMQASAPASHSWPEHVQATVFFQAQELEQATKEASYSEPDHVLYKNLHELQSHRSLSSSIHRTSIYISSNFGVTVRTSLSSHSYSTARTNNFTSLRFRASAGSSYKSYSNSRAYMPAYFQS